MSFTKRLDEARKAFAQRDLSASQRAHSPETIARAMEQHGGTSHQYIGDMVYGGLDGIVTTFAIVSGVAGANLGSGVILILGIANLLADGLSMATGAYLSLKSELEYDQREREREVWEVEHFPAGEHAELVEIYKAKGYSAQDAEALAQIQSKDRKLWVDEMMVQELGLLPDDRKPLYSALATLGAFVVAGSVPLIIYFSGLLVPIDPTASFLVTERNWFRSGLEMLIVGGLAAGVAYVIGYLLQGLGI
jgi:VIT1/CCC1 family predicted Fe2+/Mn2+ transporter